MTTLRKGPVAAEQDDHTQVIDVVIDDTSGPSVPATGPTATIRPSAGQTPVGARRRLKVAPPGDGSNLAGAAVGGIAVSLLLFGVVAPFSGLFGGIVVAYLAFVGIYATLTALASTRAVVVDRVMTVALATGAVVLFGVLLLVVLFVFVRGSNAFFRVNFFTSDQSGTGPLSPLNYGGVLHAVVGSAWMITIALAITVPLGLTCAVFLAVVRGPGSRFIRTIVEAMTALPSVVAGLFVLATWILILGEPRSGLAAALAQSVMMLPIIIRASDVVLRLVPGTLLEASEALGAPRWRTVWHVVLPTSRSGLTTAVILGSARGIGETSPVLLTAGFTTYMNYNPTDGPMVSLPLAVFNFVRSPQPAMVARGFAAGALLLLIVLVLFIIARTVAGRAPGELSDRQRRRVRRQSLADVRRFDAIAAAAVASGAGSAAFLPADLDNNVLPPEEEADVLAEPEYVVETRDDADPS